MSPKASGGSDSTGQRTSCNATTSHSRVASQGPKPRRCVALTPSMLKVATLKLIWDSSGRLEPLGDLVVDQVAAVLEGQQQPGRRAVAVPLPFHVIADHQALGIGVDVGHL